VAGFRKKDECFLAVLELDRALGLLRRLGHRAQEAETLLALGDALSAQGREDKARDRRQQALAILSTFRGQSKKTAAEQRESR
jgi:tetratricopeptide (TPR) repeat protein